MVCTQIVFVQLASRGMHNIWALNLSYAFYTTTFIEGARKAVFPHRQKEHHIGYAIYIAAVLGINQLCGWTTITTLSLIVFNLPVVLYIFFALYRWSFADNPSNSFAIWFLIPYLLNSTLSTLIFSDIGMAMSQNDDSYFELYIKLHPYLNIVTNLAYSVGLMLACRKWNGPKYHNNPVPEREERTVEGPN